MSHFFTGISTAKEVSYDLTILEKDIPPTGKKAKALMVNGIPAPSLPFNAWDTANITVNNELKKQPNSIHWHGILLSNDKERHQRNHTQDQK